MLRTTMAKAYIKRTFRPTYGWTQMTPKSVFLDPAWARGVPLWPGYVYTKGVGENVTPVTAAASVPYGFGALYVGGDGIDEVLDSGINAFAVWVMGPDAEAEILAPAFDTTENWAAADVSGAEALIYAGTTGAFQGQLVLTHGTPTTAPVARLLKVNSATKITIGGLRLK